MNDTDMDNTYSCFSRNNFLNCLLKKRKLYVKFDIKLSENYKNVKNVKVFDVN